MSDIWPQSDIAVAIGRGDRPDSEACRGPPSRCFRHGGQLLLGPQPVFDVRAMLKSTLAEIAERPGGDVGFGDTRGIVCLASRRRSRRGPLLSFCFRSFRGRHRAPLFHSQGVRIGRALAKNGPRSEKAEGRRQKAEEELCLLRAFLPSAFSLFPCPFSSRQSYRKATIGSTLEARRAGRKPARAETAIITAVAAAIVITSVGSRP